jgi:uncharacterized membrane protein YoaK (UPF0700 family)
MDDLAQGERLLLSGVAGAVDGMGYVLLHVFTAHVTGNTVQVGTDLGRIDLSSAWRPAFAILAFAAGVALGALAREACAQRGLAGRPAVLGISGLLLAVFLGAGLALGGAPGGVRFMAVAAPAALAMGCQNAAMPARGGRRAKTYITGTVTELVEALVVAASRGRGGTRPPRRAFELFGLWLAYLAGGVASGAAAAKWSVAAALLPMAGIAIAIAMDWGSRRGVWHTVQGPGARRHSRRPWIDSRRSIPRKPSPRSSS